MPRPKACPISVRQAKTAKRLYFDVIPKAVDEIHQQLRTLPRPDGRAATGEPRLHIHNGDVPESTNGRALRDAVETRVGLRRRGKEKLWGFIRPNAPEASPRGEPRSGPGPQASPIRYYNDFVKPTARLPRGPPSRKPRRCASCPNALAMRTKALKRDRAEEAQEGVEADLPAVDWHDDEFLQSIVFAIGKTHGFDPLRSWFSALYRCFWVPARARASAGSSRFTGSRRTKALIAQGLAGELAG